MFQQKVSRALFSHSVADTEQESVQTMTSFLRTVHHDGEFSPAWWGWNGARPSFHSIYHHEQSCGVRSSWEGRYTPHFTSTQFYSVVPDAVVRWVANIPSWNFEKINNPLHCPFNGLSDDSLKLDSFPVCRLKSDEIYLGWQKAKPSGRIRFRPYASYPRKLIAHLLLIRNLSADDVTPISAAGRRWVSWNTTLHVVVGSVVDALSKEDCSRQFPV